MCPTVSTPGVIAGKGSERNEPYFPSEGTQFQPSITGQTY